MEAKQHKKIAYNIRPFNNKIKNWESMEMSEQLFNIFDQGNEMVRNVILACILFLYSMSPGFTYFINGSLYLLTLSCIISTLS